MIRPISGPRSLSTATSRTDGAQLATPPRRATSSLSSCCFRDSSRATRLPSRGRIAGALRLLLLRRQLQHLRFVETPAREVDDALYFRAAGAAAGSSPRPVAHRTQAGGA